MTTRDPLLRVGHGAARLDVPDGTPMGGYAARTGGTAGLLDPLEIHAVVVAAAGRRFCWLVGDLPAVSEDLAAAVAERLAGHGFGPDLVWFGATHTHAGPQTGCRPGGGRTPAALAARVTAVAERAATAALAGAGPAHLTVHLGAVRGVGARRSGPDPRPDLPVTVLACRDGDGAVRGTVVLLPVHPTVLGPENRRVSADLAGAVRRAVAARTGGWAVVATGAAGDMSTRTHRRAQSTAELHRLAGLAAGQVCALLDGPGEPVGAAPPAGVRTPALALPARTAEPLPDLAALRAGLAAARAAGDPVGVRRAETAVQGAELAAAARVPDPRVTVSAVRIGRLRLVGLGGEPFLDLEAALRAGLDDVDGPAALVGYTNGYLGYLPTRPAYRTAGYEVNISPVAAGAAERALREGLRLARSL